MILSSIYSVWITDFYRKKNLSRNQVDELIQKRADARSKKDFKVADEVRDQLQQWELLCKMGWMGRIGKWQSRVKGFCRERGRGSMKFKILSLLFVFFPLSGWALEYDVVVVGGGLSGLVATQSLMYDKRVLLVEESDRLGGRIDTQIWDNK